jgi:hypothetical protein
MLDVLLGLSERLAKDHNGSGRAEPCENVAKTSTVCTGLSCRYKKRNNCNIMCVCVCVCEEHMHYGAIKIAVIVVMRKL